MRLDVYLSTAGFASSRTRAREWIEHGFVLLNGKTVRKPAYAVDEAAPPDICITGRTHPYVGRGGMKLSCALARFSVDPAGKTCADIGASTGGFTDCLLQHGAARVFAVDSGSGQLAPILLSDTRVVNMEHCNARYITPDTLGTLCDIVVADLSFISQTYVLPNISALLNENGVYIGLIKPQFECGPGVTDHRGIVKSPAQHAGAVCRVRNAAADAGLCMTDVILSPISGGDGNREFLCCCTKMRGTAPVTDDVIDRLVNL